MQLEKRHRLTQALRYVEESGLRGVTSVEYGREYSLHHGQSSAALSELHQLGLAARLAEKRDGRSVYVSPAHVDDRITVLHRSQLQKQRKAQACDAVSEKRLVELIEEWLETPERSTTLARAIRDEYRTRSQSQAA